MRSPKATLPLYTTATGQKGQPASAVTPIVGVHSPSSPKIDLNDIGSRILWQENKRKNDLYPLKDVFFFLWRFILEAVLGDESCPKLGNQVCNHILLGLRAEAPVSLAPQVA